MLSLQLLILGRVMSEAVELDSEDEDVVIIDEDEEDTKGAKG